MSDGSSKVVWIHYALIALGVILGGVIANKTGVESKGLRLAIGIGAGIVITLLGLGVVELIMRMKS